MHPRIFVAAMVALSTVGLAACNTFEDKDAEHRHVADTSPYAGVPANAIRAAQGYGTVRYRTTQAGRVLIGDDVQRKVITETQVRAGDEIIVDAEGDRVLVNGSAVYNQNLLKGDQHSIFFVGQ